jgi:hypothetical protein
VHDRCPRSIDVNKALAALAALLALVLLPVSVAGADQRLASEVARAGVWANTTSGTPAVYGSGSSPCWSDVAVRNGDPNLTARLKRTPLPCTFAPAGGGDAEAVVVDQTGAAQRDYYEFWTLRKESLSPTRWSVGWGGAADYSEMVQSAGLRVWPGWMGTQASGIAFMPGLIRTYQLQAGVIGHPVQLVVPYSCPTWKPPATRTDTNASGNPLDKCIKYGQKYKLPASVDISHLSRVARMIAQAAKDYYVVVTDQSHDRVIWRLEGVKPGAASPYTKVGGLFGCDGRQNGRAVTAATEYDCYPNEQAVFKGFPWAQLVAVN